MLFDEMDEDGFSDDLLDVEQGADDSSSSIEPDVPKTPRVQDQFIGNEAVEAQLLKMFQMGRMPHGLVFTGQPGVGKATMAYRLARFLLAQAELSADQAGPGLFGEPEPLPPATSLHIPVDHPVFARVASGGHSDLLTVERQFDEKSGRMKGSVSVDDIRRIAPFMRMTPSVEKGWRIVVIDDADTMTRSSQNSLLKILEEPPERSILILVTHRSGALLPTIYSRCVALPFHPLDEGHIRAALLRRGVKESSCEIVIKMAEGSLGRALDYAREEQFAVIGQTLSLLAGAPKLSWSEIQHFADQIGSRGNDEAQRAFQETLLWAAGFLVRQTALGQVVPENIEFSGLRALQNQFTLADFLKICDSLQAHFDMVQSGNLDKRFLVMGAYMAFELR